MYLFGKSQNNDTWHLVVNLPNAITKPVCNCNFNVKIKAPAISEIPELAKFCKNCSKELKIRKENRSKQVIFNTSGVKQLMVGGGGGGGCDTISEVACKQ